jgi:hypothetical protein
MTWTAVEEMDSGFHPGLRYIMAEVLLGNLCEKGEHTEDLFPSPNPSQQKRSWTYWISSMNNGVGEHFAW